MNNIYKQIYKLIHKYNNIIIARHVGPDPDGLGSSFALKEIIKHNFPNKNVYTVGASTSKFKFLGTIDSIPESAYENSLGIVLDTPDLKRLDGLDMSKVAASIKIDHHPLIDEFCDVELVDATSSSVCQMIIELVEHTRLNMTKSAFEKLYIGLVADTNRFLYAYTTPRTFELVAKYVRKFNVDVSKLYDGLYLKPISEIRFQGFLEGNLTLTENGLAYIYLDTATISEYKVDAASAGNMINNLNYIEEAVVVATLSEDVKNNVIRVSIRSRGPVINHVAEEFAGGGHIFAAGARLTSKDQIEVIIQKLDEVCAKYQKV